jgi:hypothetical protein
VEQVKPLAVCDESTLEDCKTHLAQTFVLKNETRRVSPLGVATPWGGNSALMWAAMEGHAEVVKILLAAGGKSEQQHEGWPSLSLAASEGHADVTRVLVEDGGAVDHRCGQGSPGSACARGRRDWQGGQGSRWGVNVGRPGAPGPGPRGVTARPLGGSKPP